MVCIYDSGVGGLSTLAALRALCPAADVVYLGDTARVPYGPRDAATLCRFATEALDYLAALSPEAILVACGTVSTVALPHLSGRYSIPVLGVAEAGIRVAAAGDYHRLAVLGTEATVKSGTFACRLAELCPTAAVRSVACPLFVSLAEAGLVAEDDPTPRLVAERTLAPLFDFAPEAILLGCTHFPWLSAHIGRLFPAAHLINCGEAAAAALAPLLGQGGRGTTRFLVTEGAEAFLRTYRRLTGDTTPVTVTAVTLTQKNKEHQDKKP